MNLRKLIPADDLHWTEEDDFIPLSPHEYDKLIVACHKSRHKEIFKDFENILKVVRWAEEIKIGSLLINGLFCGRLGITFEKGMPAPHFHENTEEESDEYRNACRLVE